MGDDFLPKSTFDSETNEINGDMTEPRRWTLHGATDDIDGQGMPIRLAAYCDPRLRDGECVRVIEATPPEARLADAVSVIARRALAHVIINSEWELWEDFPEIGQDDWTQVEQEIQRIGRELEVPQAQFQSAYEWLVARAEAA